MRRLFIAFLALAIPATASFAPGFAAQVLVRESTAIVIGKVEYLSSTPTTETFSGLQVPAKEYFARVNVEQVLKGGPDLLRSVSLHWNILLPPADSAYESPPDGRHMLLFLKADELPNTYTFASRYYPGVFVGRPMELLIPTLVHETLPMSRSRTG